LVAFFCFKTLLLPEILRMSFSPKIKSKCTPKRLAVKLNAKGEQFVLQNHPWVFSNNITKINDNAKSGDLAIIFGKNKNRVIGLGLYDANSPIRIKMLHSDVETRVIKNKHQQLPFVVW